MANVIAYGGETVKINRHQSCSLCCRLIVPSLPESDPTRKFPMLEVTINLAGNPHVITASNEGTLTTCYVNGVSYILCRIKFFLQFFMILKPTVAYAPSRLQNHEELSKQTLFNSRPTEHK